MNAAEDDDLKLQRASSSLLLDLEDLLPKLLRKKRHDAGPGEVRQQVREIELWRIFGLVCLSRSVQVNNH